MDNQKTQDLLNQISEYGIAKIDSYSHPIKTKGKSINMSLGRQFFNSLLPDDFRLINETITKKQLSELIKEILKIYGTEKTSDVVADIQKYGFKLATLQPASFNIEGLVPPQEWVEKKNEFQNNPPSDPEEYTKKVKEITMELIDYIKNQGMSVQNILEGGVKGNPIADWSAIMVSKGFVVDIENNILGPIKHSINDGFDPIEYYQGASEARRGFYYRSTAVADPGYLARKIAMANALVQISKTIKDCKSKKYFELLITKENSHLVAGRYYYDGGIKFIEDHKELIGKNIKLRSPLFCKAEDGICEICYGNLAKKMNTPNIGILASGAMNSVGVNAFMKMRHQASQINIVEIDFNKLFKDSNIDMILVNSLFKIEKDKITAKKPLKIILDNHDYDERTLIDNGEYYQLPGIFDIIYGEEPNIERINLPFSFKVKLYKPENTENDGSLIVMNYDSGEMIIQQKSYVKEIDPTVISKLFEGGAKYINDPIILTNTLNQQVPNVDFVHLETIIQNMFRDKSDNTKLGRLVGYENCIIMGQKKLPFINSWLNSMAFENINKAISNGLLNEKSIQFDPFEKMILEKFDRMDD